MARLQLSLRNKQDVIIPDPDRIQIRSVFTAIPSLNISLILPVLPPRIKNPAGNTRKPEPDGRNHGITDRLLLVSFLLGFAFNFPSGIIFQEARKLNRPVKPRIEQFCKKFLLSSPLINIGILFLSYGITLLYMLYIIFFKKDLDDLNREFYLQFFFITLLSSVLTLMLVYFWMKHRVHLSVTWSIFIHEEELKKGYSRQAGADQEPAVDLQRHDNLPATYHSCILYHTQRFLGQRTGN